MSRLRLLYPMILGALLGACAAPSTPRPDTAAVSPPKPAPSAEAGPAPVTTPVATSPAEVFLTEAEARAARNRYLGDPAARALGQKILADADALVAAPLDIPRAGGQWTHWYVCPKDGGRLEAQSPTAHRCVACGAVQSGYPYDEAHISQRHMRWTLGVETLGWAHALDPKPAYARRAREILLFYAGFYRDLPLRDRENGQGRSAARMFAQTLDESVALCRLSVGYGLVRGAAAFLPEDHARIEEGLIRPMAETAGRNPMGISNWQSWHNAAQACAGFLLNDETLIRRALRGVNGFEFQLENALFPSGFWHEQAPLYHYYALHAHLYLLEAAARGGQNLYGDPRVRGMFDAPLRKLYPDLSFPAIHNSDRASVRDMGQYYAVAWRRYADLRYATLATKMDHPWMLFWGAPAPPGEPDLRLATSNDPGEGIAVLRDAANTIAVMMDYGPGAAGHVHPARLNVLLFAGGNERLVDPGRLPYGSPLQGEWYTQTVAHNTVTVDGRSQARSPGRLIQFEARAGLYQLRQAILRMVEDVRMESALISALDPGAPIAFVAAAADEAYPGVRLQRLVALQGGTVLDVFLAESEAGATFDLPLHWRATLTGLDAAQPAPPLGHTDGYQHFQNTRAINPGTREFTADLGPRGRIQVRVFDTHPMFLADGYGRTPAEIIPTTLRRATGDRALFAAVYTVEHAGAR